MKQSRFDVKDLVYAGLFSLLVLMVTWTVGMVGFFPIFMPAIPFLTSLISAPVFMLYATRIRTFGMVFIMGVVFAIAFSLSGHSMYVVPGCMSVALIAEWILKKGEYKRVNAARWAYTVYALYGAFNLLPIYIARDAFTKSLIQQGYGEAYANKLMQVLPDWSFLPIIIMGCVGAYIGCSIGIKMLCKHFEKAGMV